MEHGGGVELLDDGGTGEDVAGRQGGAVVDRRLPGPVAVEVDGVASQPGMTVSIDPPAM